MPSRYNYVSWSKKKVRASSYDKIAFKIGISSTFDVARWPIGVYVPRTLRYFIGIFVYITVHILTVM